MPLAVDRSHLVDPAIIGVEEVSPVRNALCMRRLHTALLPLRWTQTPPVLPGFWNHVDSVLYLVLNTSRESGHKAPSPCYLLLAHMEA